MNNEQPKENLTVGAKLTFRVRGANRTIVNRSERVMNVNGSERERVSPTLCHTTRRFFVESPPPCFPFRHGALAAAA